MRYEMINYDVWGNRREGFWVNQAFRTGTFVEIPDDASDAEIIRILKREGILKKGVRTSSVRIDGETGHALYFEHAPSSRPKFELRAVEERGQVDLCRDCGKPLTLEEWEKSVSEALLPLCEEHLRKRQEDWENPVPQGQRRRKKESLGRRKPCVLCKCPSTGESHGFPVCDYHKTRGEDDPDCPTCRHPRAPAGKTEGVRAAPSRTPRKEWRRLKRSARMSASDAKSLASVTGGSVRLVRSGIYEYAIPAHYRFDPWTGEDVRGFGARLGRPRSAAHGPACRHCHHKGRRAKPGHTKHQDSK